MATATATTKIATKPENVHIDPRRSPLGSPTVELKSNPLDAVSKAPLTSSSPPKPVADSKLASIPTPTDPDNASPVTPAAAADEEEDVPSSDVIINEEIFEQILELDDESLEFTRGMVEEYLKQAVTTFKNMDEAFAGRDLKKLSDLGHFLKGSSAALGVDKVKSSCERMQYYGELKDARGLNPIEPEVALARMPSLLVRVKNEFQEAKTELNKRIAV